MGRRALPAIRQEADDLIAAGTWDLITVVEKEDLVARAKQAGERIHLGVLITICSIRFAEFVAEFQKHEGRVVFLCNIRGAAAVFRELSAHPTGVVAANANLAYGVLPAWQ